MWFTHSSWPTLGVTPRGGEGREWRDWGKEGCKAAGREGLSARVNEREREERERERRGGGGGGEPDRQTVRQTDRQTDRQTEKDRNLLSPC